MSSREGTGVTEADEVRRAFRDGASLDITAGDVRLVLDGAPPFLVIVRGTAPGDPFARLVQGEAGYLRAGPDADPARIRETVRQVTAAGVEAHGAFLLVELWGGLRSRVLGPDGPAPATVRALAQGLEALRGLAEPAGVALSEAVEVVGTPDRHPPGLEPLLDVRELHERGALLVGVELQKTWRDPGSDRLYPVHLRRLGHALSPVLRRAAFEFLRVQAGTDLSSYRALGRRSLGEAVWEADRRLAEIDASFDSLLLVAPVNERAAWARFRDGGFDRAPEFHYRLLPVEPDLLKRELYEIPLERVEDPASWQLLRDKREELDRQISLLGDRGSPAFLHSSMRLFGPVDAALRARASEILEYLPPPEPPAPAARVGAAAFADLARQEFAHYRARYDGFTSEVQLRPDLVGLMVSSGKLLIGQDLELAPERVDALLQHEVGTHVLTYVNGRAQPFRQLAHGFADYDELQEGLGVLAEFLVDGLTAARIRLLAARVVAVDARIQGADFMESFRLLHRDHGFTPGSAFDITTRVQQSGGFTRDLIYLRGFVRLVEHLREGGPLEPLYVGKIAARHIDVVQELREREVLGPIPLQPRFLERPASQDRLRALRDGLPLREMIAAPPPPGGPSGRPPGGQSSGPSGPEPTRP